MCLMSCMQWFKAHERHSLHWNAISFFPRSALAWFVIKSCFLSLACLHCVREAVMYHYLYFRDLPCLWSHPVDACDCFIFFGRLTFLNESLLLDSFPLHILSIMQSYYMLWREEHFSLLLLRKSFSFILLLVYRCSRLRFLWFPSIRILNKTTLASSVNFIEITQHCDSYWYMWNSLLLLAIVMSY